MMSNEIEDFQLAGLTIRVAGYQFPKFTDVWDGNWLWVTATLNASGAWVEASGPFLRTDELERLATELALMHSGKLNEVSWKPMEQTINIDLQSNTLGQMTMTVQLTPDNVTQEHRITLEIDQSYLPDAVQSLKRILNRFPMRS